MHGLKPTGKGRLLITVKVLREVFEEFESDGG